MKELKFKNVSDVIFKNNYVKFKRNGEQKFFRGVENVIVTDRLSLHNDKRNKNIVIQFMDSKSENIPFFNVGDFIMRKNNMKETCELVTDIKEHEYNTCSFCKEAGNNKYGEDIYGTGQNCSTKEFNEFRFATSEEINEWYDWLKKNDDKLVLDSVNNRIYHTKWDNWYREGEMVVYDECHFYRYKRCGYFENGKIEDEKEIPNEIMLEDIKTGREEILIDFSKIRRATEFEKRLYKKLDKISNIVEDDFCLND